MSKLFSLLLVFLVLLPNAFSINQIPFPLKNTSWFVQEGGSHCPGFLDWCYKKEYRYEGDTVINSVTYSKLIKYVRHTMETEHVKHYAGSIRYDEKLNQVIGIDENKDEFMIYNFNIEIGDTTTVYGPTIGITFDTAVVTGIDSSLLDDGLYHKNIYLQSILNTVFGTTPSPYWLIEGVGSSNGILEGPAQYSVDFIFSQLHCVELNGQSYFNGPCHHDVVLDISKTSSLSGIKVYPNPSTDNVFLYSEQDIVSVDIISLSGKLLDTQSSRSVAVGFLIPGIYYLKIKVVNYDIPIYLKFVKL